MTVERATKIFEHQAEVLAMQQASRAVTEASIIAIEARSDVDSLRERHKDMTSLIDDVEHKLREIEAEMQLAKREATAARDEVSNFPGGLDFGPDANLQEIAGDRTVDAVDDEIEAEEAKLELIHSTNPNALAEFERRAAEIEHIQSTIENRRAHLEQLAEDMRDVRNEWEPRLDDIIAKINDAFSYNFAQINCAGEVGVHKDEDFDQWAIEIKVKFRYVKFFLVLCPSKPRQLTGRTKRTRNLAAAESAPTVWRRTSRVHYLLPHVTAVHGASSFPGRRRDQSGYGPAKRADGT